jgi:hypothetical protein
MTRTPTIKSWVYAFKIQRNLVTTANFEKLTTEHGFSYVHMEGLRTANGSKKKVKFLVFDNQVIDQEAEIFILQNEKFIQFADQTGLNDQSRFDAFAETIDGHVQELFHVIRNDGTQWYDPAHQDADTDEGFVRMLRALFVLWCKHNNPADSLATRILSFEWKNHTIRGTFYSPSAYKLRLQSLWRIHDMLPLIGDPTTDEAKLKTSWNGLTDEARDYIIDEKEVDPFDTENHGANQITYTDLFDLLEPFWNRKYKKKYENFVEDKKGGKRKRDDDEDADDDDDDDGHDNRRNRNGKRQRNDKRKGRGNGNGKRNDRNGRRNDRGGGKRNNFNAPCQLHEGGGHPYKDCIFCPTGNNFKADRAKQFYESGKAPQWYKKTYESRVLNGNGGGKQQQQYLIQPQPGASFMAIAPASAPQQQLPPTVPTYFAGQGIGQPAPGQLAPTFATGTTSTAPAQKQQAYTIRTDASGKQYLVPM